MLAESQRYLHEHHAEAQLWVFGQDYNKRAFAVAASDLLIKGHENSEVRFGDSLTDDQFSADKFDYFLANPPFGVDWKKQATAIEKEHEVLGDKGRFGAGLPRVNDGALLFLQHMVSKFEPVQPDQHKHGSRLAIVFNGSPLFTGGAGSGESDIRKWIIENDWLEAVVAMPEQMFYNTGIGTYVWIVTNRKEKRRRGKIQPWTRARVSCPCAAAWATNAANSVKARTANRTRSAISCGSMPASRMATTARFSTTKISVTRASPWNARCGFGWNSTPTRKPNGSKPWKQRTNKTRSVWPRPTS
jgi:hypothetical protein